MIILIPLGGTGERFKNQGYTKPKSLINVFGKPIIFYLLDNLNLDDVELVCIPYNKEYSNYNFEDLLRNNYPKIKFQFIKLNKNTEGAAETINIALKELNDIDKPILCLDGDNFYTKDIINMWNQKNAIFTFIDESDTDLYSYIKTEDNIIVTDIVEKNKISKYACSGAYGFSSTKLLLTYTQFILDNKIKQKNEYYTSNVIKEMLKNNIQFINISISPNDYVCLGTPIQLISFYNNYAINSCITDKYKIKKMRICFDLDNTLVSFPEIKGDYTTVKPIINNINFLRYLKNLGHTIIIYTARRMNTHNGNIGKCLYDIGKITFDTLEKFNIQYDEIYFGKPYADVYIDDLALNCHSNMEKELGFYMDKIDPRKFNKLEINNINTIKKMSNNLESEIYYYKNIPICIKDMFPIFIDYDYNNTWYLIEKIDGINVSHLYVNELLTENTLIHIMNSINRIHNSIKDENIDKLNIYSNYCDKLKNRYDTYDYSIYKNSKNVFNYLYNELEKYENEEKGQYGVIHGDTVLTNILINRYDKIKFIDMRGKLGNILTIKGDIFYDWAKLFQSLVGYDKVLQNKNISNNYEKHMIDVFKNYFIDKFSEEQFKILKILTQSLLFTLIPLHDNDMCVKFYELIENI
ncbi:hypothetical protein Indivirus_8_5 [Indivirus ILV1]|uniref:Nucleotidyl transferase domain-containing protein n=1 Tax=Indivirus ILV1 TaxID=1977633 RepID=A0A1V0SE67_9VIRU|nr:hypothetical protein Indivirus_8_5 [Indivirus ILV1]